MAQSNFNNDAEYSLAEVRVKYLLDEQLDPLSTAKLYFVTSNKERVRELANLYPNASFTYRNLNRLILSDRYTVKQFAIDTTNNAQDITISIQYVDNQPSSDRQRDTSEIKLINVKFDRFIGISFVIDCMRTRQNNERLVDEYDIEYHN